MCFAQCVSVILGERVTGLVTNVSVRQQPISQQPGAVQCQRFDRWFRSRGGFSVHKCRTIDPPIQSEPITEQLVVRSDCDRNFRRPADLKRHKCLSERSKPIHEQHGSVQCEHCQRWMRSAGGLAVHRRTCNLPM